MARSKPVLVDDIVPERGPIAPAPAAQAARVRQLSASEIVERAIAYASGVGLYKTQEEAEANYLADLSSAEVEEVKREARAFKARTAAQAEREETKAKTTSTPGVATPLRDRAVDLSTLMREGIPPVEYMAGPLARRVVYSAGVTGFTGHPDSGKTSLVCRLALDAMREGQHVVYLDYEQGEAETIRRFAAVGAQPDDLAPERLTYVPFPGAPDWDELGGIWDEHPGAVGIFDSSRGILRTLGLDEDRASEVGRFMDPLVEHALTREVPCLLIDHVSKAATSSSGYARGSGDKLAAVQAQWYVDKTRAFSETETGEIELTRWKARSGGLARRLRFTVGDGAGALTFRALDPDETPQGRTDAAIIAFLREAGGSQPLSKIEDGVEGKAVEIRDRVKALAADGHRPVEVDESGKYPRYAYAPEVDSEPYEALSF